MKLAVLYICTGKYSVFWPEFYKTCQQNFYPEIDKKYFVFTDDDKLIKSFKDNNKVQSYFQRRAGWPYDTLMRFNTFCTVQDILQDYDYCYFWNANTIFLKPIDESTIPFPTKDKNLVLWRHTLTYNDDEAITFTVEKNPLSTAHITRGTKCHEYGGGFFGGTAEGFIKMSQTIRDNIATDLQNGIIAIWHDQSHLQKYSSSASFLEVPQWIICSEEYVGDKEPYAIFANKQRYGGMHSLREMPLSFRFRVQMVNYLRKTSTLLGIKPFAKAIYKKFYYSKK